MSPQFDSTFGIRVGVGVQNGTNRKIDPTFLYDTSLHIIGLYCTVWPHYATLATKRQHTDWQSDRNIGRPCSSVDSQKSLFLGFSVQHNARENSLRELLQPQLGCRVISHIPNPCTPTIRCAVQMKKSQSLYGSPIWCVICLDYVHRAETIRQESPPVGGAVRKATPFITK